MKVRVETGVIRRVSNEGNRASVTVMRDNKEYRVTILLKNGRTYFNYGENDLGHFDFTRLKELPKSGTAVVLYCEEHNPLFAKLWAEQPQASGRRLGSLASNTVTRHHEQGLRLLRRQPPRFMTVPRAEPATSRSAN